MATLYERFTQMMTDAGFSVTTSAKFNPKNDGTDAFLPAVAVLSPTGGAVNTVTTQYTAVATNTKSYAPTAGTQWALVFAHVTYTADATVGNRYIIMQLLDASANVVGDWHCSVAITASLAGYHVEFLPGTYRETAFDASHTVQVPFPVGLMVPNGYTLKIFDEANISASDSMVIGLEYQVSAP